MPSRFELLYEYLLRRYSSQVIKWHEWSFLSLSRYFFCIKKFKLGHRMRGDTRECQSGFLVFTLTRSLQTYRTLRDYGAIVRFLDI